MAELKLQMEDYSKAFPRKMSAEPYMHIITAAKDAAMGEDKMPRVVIVAFETKELMEKAATAIRRWSATNGRILSVSEDEHTRKMKVYRLFKPRASQRRTKKDASAPPVAKTTSNEGAS